MRMRHEQHQAYRFLTRRIVSAMLSAEPETNELPMRRFAIALAGSLALAALAFAGVGIYGLIVPGGGRPAENAIIVERETGAKFVYLRGQLHPVLNWTSARLILGQADPPVDTMSRTSLRDVPRGRPVGIPNAPDTLPDKGSLLGLPWSVCTAPRSPTSVALATHVLVGSVPPGGHPLADNEGVLVTAASGSQRFLVWRDHRLRVPDNAVVAALGWAGVHPAPVGDAFLNALPAGPDLAPISLTDAGQRANVSVDGSPATVGQLFRASDKNYVMLKEGLAPIGELTVRLATASGRTVFETTAQEVGRVLLDTTIEPPGWPEDVPVAHGSDDRFAMACAVYRGATDVERPVTVESYDRVADGMALPAEAANAPGSTDGGPTADRIVVPGGHGALARTLTPTGATAPGNAFLITDQGLKFPLPAPNLDAVLGSLGYAGVAEVSVPASMLALIPTGASLDPQAAALFAPPAVVAPPPTEAPSQ